MSKREKKDEKEMDERSLETHPDPIPPLHVLEAAEDQEKKETEDLLAGFNRPGRGPKKAPVERDFVDYFTKKTSEPRVAAPRSADAGAAGVVASAAGGAGAAGAGPSPRKRQVDISTVIVARKGDRPSWVTWVIAGAVMIALGGAVAFVATRDDAKPASPGAATTITNATPPPTARTSNDEIPPPPPASEVAPAESAAETTALNAAATTPSSGAAKKRDPKSAASAGATGAGGPGTGAAGATGATTTPGAPTAAPSVKPPPRDDLIRGM